MSLKFNGIDIFKLFNYSILIVLPNEYYLFNYYAIEFTTIYQAKQN